MKNPNDQTGALEGGPFRIFQHPLLQNIKKLKGDALVKKNSEKSPTMPKKLEGWTLWNFCNIHFIAKLRKKLNNSAEQN